MPSWTVRPVDHTEDATARAIVAVQQAAYRVEADLIGYDRMPPLVESPVDVARLELTILGVHDGERLVGLAGYGVDASGDDAVVEIERLAVDPAWARRGIGRALVTAVHEHEAHATRFEVSTGTANAPAVTLYLSLGYEEVDAKVLDGCPVTFFVRSPSR